MTIARQPAEAKCSPGLRATIKRYPGQYRRQLWLLTSQSLRMKDLLTSCPAAALAISALPTADPARGDALRLVEEGAPLISILRQLDLPSWYKRIPPEAFGSAPAKTPAGAGDDTAFGAQILNLLPSTNAAMTGWVDVVMAARAVGGDEFALWIGRQKITRTSRRARLPVAILALHAWHSRRPEQPAGQLVAARWNPNLSLGRAACEARIWLLGVLQELCACELPASYGDKRTTQVDGVDFVPLTTPTEILAEARAMRNCLGGYVGPVAAGHCRLYGLRVEGRRIATLEIRRDGNPPEPVMNQLCGPRNFAPPPEIVLAAKTWFLLEEANLRRELRLDFNRQSEEAFALKVWRPFAEHMERGHRTLADVPSPSIADVLRDADGLAAYAK